MDKVKKIQKALVKTVFTAGAIFIAALIFFRFTDKDKYEAESEIYVKNPEYTEIIAKEIADNDEIFHKTAYSMALLEDGEDLKKITSVEKSGENSVKIKSKGANPVFATDLCDEIADFSVEFLKEKNIEAEVSSYAFSKEKKTYSEYEKAGVLGVLSLPLFFVIYYLSSLKNEKIDNPRRASEKYRVLAVTAKIKDGEINE